MNVVERFKSLPGSSRRLLSVGIILALVVALPLFIWSITHLDFNPNKKAASGEATPTPLATVSVNWQTAYAKFIANDFYIMANGRKFTGSPIVNINSDPGSSTYTTLETIWNEDGVEMRMFMYFRADGRNWWLREVRIYDGRTDGDWIYLLTNAEAYKTPIGQTYSQNTPGMLTLSSSELSDTAVGVHFGSLDLQAFVNQTTNATPPPTVRPFEIKFKFDGINDDSASNAKVSVRFVSNRVLGSTLGVVTPPVSIVYDGNGVYRLLVGVWSAELPSANDYALILKGEKHLGVKFCNASGQTTHCSGSEQGRILIPANPLEKVFLDFTKILLPAGDTYPQDGIANSSDFDKIKNLLTKPCDQLTSQDKLVGDLDYNGCVNVRDAFLMRQTLQTRYDEN